MKKFFKSTGFFIIAAFLISLLIESTLLQYRFYMPMLVGAQASTVNAEQITEGRYIVKPKQSPVTSIELVTDCESYTMNVCWADEGNSKTWFEGGEKQITPYTSNSKVYYLLTQGNCSQLEITVSDMQGCSVSEVRLNQPHFDIRWLRVLIITAVAVLIRLAMVKRPWALNTLVNKASFNKAATAIITAVYVLVMVFIFLTSPGGYDANTESHQVYNWLYEQPDTNDPYMMQTDAFVKGQLWFDIPVDESLLELENPYDVSEREGAVYKWDFAYFEGKYYSYFGAVPIVLVLLPFRLITGNFLSSYIFAFLLGVGAAVMLARLYAALVKRYLPSLAPFAYCVGLIVTLSGSMLAFLSARSWFYEIAYNSGLLLLFASLTALVSAADCGRHRCLRLAVSGLLFGLSVGCRPVFLLAAIVMLPIYIEIMKGSTSLSARVKLTAALVSPAVAVGVLLAIYNYARFESFLQFGAAYQLTVSNINYNTAANVPVGVEGTLAYLFRTPRIDAQFPFVHLHEYDFAQGAHMLYEIGAVGLFCYPVMWGLILSPMLFKRGQKNSLKGVVAAALVCVLLTAYCTATTAGVFQRYVVDFQWLAVLAAVAVWLFAIDKAKGDAAGLNAMFFACSVLTVLIALPVCLMGEFSRIEHTCPQLFYVLKDTFEIFY